ncbi:MAG: aminotransferase class V-fold PLP-dependent enzyme, partial [bacterium]
DFIEIYGYKEVNEKRFSILPFNVKDLHSHDVSFVLDKKNVVIRVGHHCAQLVHHKLNISSSCRVSLAFYNTIEEVDNFVEALLLLKDFFLRK